MEGVLDGFPRAAMASPPPQPPSSFLGSATSSGGAQMLSFSSNSAAGSSTMQGMLARVRGPFTPTQWMELQHQALIYKHFEANVPVPSSLVMPIRRSLHPWSSHGSSSLGWSFRPGSTDVEPGRCRRTDGKKWRCSRDAVGDQKYCERHIKRGCHRSRKHVESQKATPTIADPSMAVSGGLSLQHHAVPWEQQVKNSSTNVTDPFPRESNRKLLEKQKMQDRLSVSTPLDSFDFASSRSSQNYDKVGLSPMELQHDIDQAYVEHGVGCSAEKGYKSQENLLLVSRETIDDGPLGEVFRSKVCQSASADILTDQWTVSCDLHSPIGILQMPSSNTVPVENHMSSNGYLIERMVNSQTVPTSL